MLLGFKIETCNVFMLMEGELGTSNKQAYTATQWSI